jgi:hypothetical protein
MNSTSELGCSGRVSLEANRNRKYVFNPRPAALRARPIQPTVFFSSSVGVLVTGFGMPPLMRVTFKLASGLIAGLFVLIRRRHRRQG